MCVLVYFSPSTVKLAVLVTQAHAHDSRRTHAHIGAGTGRKGQFPCPCARHQSRPQILPPRSRPAPACLASLGLSHWQPQAPFNVDEQTPWQFLQVCLCIGLGRRTTSLPRTRGPSATCGWHTTHRSMAVQSRKASCAMVRTRTTRCDSRGRARPSCVCWGARGQLSLPTEPRVRARARAMPASTLEGALGSITGIHDLAP